AEAVAAVEAAVRAGDLPQALALARAALDRGIVHPLLLNLRAYWLENQGRPQEARADLERAHSLAPEDPYVLNALGLNLGRHGLFPEAIAAFDKAIALNPDLAHAHANRGYAYESMSELDPARASYERAV